MSSAGIIYMYILYILLPGWHSKPKVLASRQGDREQLERVPFVHSRCSGEVVAWFMVERLSLGILAMFTC